MVMVLDGESDSIADAFTLMKEHRPGVSYSRAQEEAAEHALTLIGKREVEMTEVEQSEDEGGDSDSSSASLKAQTSRIDSSSEAGAVTLGSSSPGETKAVIL